MEYERKKLKRGALPLSMSDATISEKPCLSASGENNSTLQQDDQVNSISISNAGTPQPHLETFNVGTEHTPVLQNNDETIMQIDGELNK